MKHIFQKEGSILWVMFTKVQIRIFFSKKNMSCFKRSWTIFESICWKKGISLWFKLKKFHLPSHKKVFNSWSQKIFKKVQFFESFFLERSPLFLWRKFNSLSQIFENPVQSFWVKFNQRAQFFALCWKKGSILWVTLKSSTLWVTLKWRFNSLSHVKKKVQFFESCQKGSILWLFLWKGSILLSRIQRKCSFLWVTREKQSFGSYQKKKFNS